MFLITDPHRKTMKMSRLLVIAWVFSVCLFPVVTSATTNFGYVERVLIQPGNLSLKAKLDTGAVLASIDAVHVKTFKKKNDIWVRFEVPRDEGNVVLERRLERYVKIKARTGEKMLGLFKRHSRRAVVLLKVTLGNQTKSLEVNLANRTQFNYPLLLGREALIAFSALVDPAKAFTATGKVD